jgi:dihydrolipoamide dehydrogenase
MLDSSEHYHNAVHNFKTHGIDVKGDIQVNLKQMIERKNGVVKQTCDGIDFLMKKNKIDVFKGVGSFENKNRIKVSGEKELFIDTEKVIIATGSKPASLPGIDIDKKRIITSTEALNLTEVPKQMLIIGGGVIGLELGSVYARLGAKVSVIEYTSAIIPTMDGALSKELQRVLRKQGFDFYFNHKVKTAKTKGKEVVVTADNEKGEEVTFTGDYCLISVGRKPYTDGLGLEHIGLMHIWKQQ